MPLQVTNLICSLYNEHIYTTLDSRRSALSPSLIYYVHNLPIYLETHIHTIFPKMLKADYYYFAGAVHESVQPLRREQPGVAGPGQLDLTPQEHLLLQVGLV